MKRKIRPAEEEISGVIPAIVFTAVWYSVLIRSIAAAGFDPFLLVFLAAGLLMPYTAVNNVRRALFYRRQRAEAVALGDVVKAVCLGKDKMGRFSFSIRDVAE